MNSNPVNTAVIPGCFGAATVFAFDSEVCKSCPAGQDCAPAAMQTLDRIKTVVKVDDLMARHRKAREKAIKDQREKDRQAIEAAPPGPMATPAPTKPVARCTPAEKVEYEVSEKHALIIAEMPSKAQTFAMSLCKKGFVKEMRKNMANKKATPGLPKWLNVALDELTKNGFTRASLKARLMNDLGWTDGTAGSHISIAIAILTGFEIAIETNGGFRVSPTIDA